MVPISDSELNQQAIDILNLTPDFCSIIRPVKQESDGAGGFREVYTVTPTGTHISCNAFPARGLASLAMDVEQNEQGRVIGQWLIQLPVGTDVFIRDRIVMEGSGRVFEVITPNVPQSFSAVLSVKASLVQ
jgi:hypothetical protein